MGDYKLVYSTDPKLMTACPKCKELLSSCECAKTKEMPRRIVAKLRIEKAKRGGKTVTVIDGLPAIDDYLKTLAKELKQSFGVGGTHGINGGVGYIEIQGERREALREILARKDITVKG